MGGGAARRPPSVAEGAQRELPVEVLCASSIIATASVIWLPMVCTGLNEVIGSWKIMEMSLRRSVFMVSLSRAALGALGSGCRA